MVGQALPIRMGKRKRIRKGREGRGEDGREAEEERISGKPTELLWAFSPLDMKPLSGHDKLPGRFIRTTDLSFPSPSSFAPPITPIGSSAGTLWRPKLVLLPPSAPGPACLVASLDSTLLLLCTTLLGVGLDVLIHRPLQAPPTPPSCPGLLLVQEHDLAVLMGGRAAGVMP